MRTLLQSLDKEAFLFFNHGHSRFFDQLMYSCRDLLLWLPLFFLCLYIVTRYRRNRARPHVFISTAIVFIIITIQLVISILALPPLLKPLAKRERPVYNAELIQSAELRNSSYPDRLGFFSSKVCAALAITFFLIAFAEVPKWMKVLLVLWALLISYNRIFIGAQYPGNVLVSALIGTGIGLLSYRYFIYLKEKVLVI